MQRDGMADPPRLRMEAWQAEITRTVPSYHREQKRAGTLTGRGLLMEGYWAYAKERLLRPHGVADEHLLLYLKETEYRFNHRDLDQEEFVQHLLSEVLLS